MCQTTREGSLILSLFCLLRVTVATQSGHVYERSAIELWLSDHNSDPYTNQELQHRELVSVLPLKKVCPTSRRCPWRAKAVSVAIGMFTDELFSPVVRLYPCCDLSAGGNREERQRSVNWKGAVVLKMD